MATVPNGTLDPARLQAILQRIASGAYNHPDVISRIADGIRKELR